MAAQRALASLANGRCASRTTCLRSASDFRRLTKHENGTGLAHTADHSRVCDGPADPEAALWLVRGLAKVSPRTARVIARAVTQDHREIDESLVAVTKLRLSGRKASGEPSRGPEPSDAAEQGRGGRLARWEWRRPEASSRRSWSASEAPP